jgi:hypothetical protein
MTSIFGNGKRPATSRTVSSESTQGEQPAPRAEETQPSPVETAVAEHRETGFESASRPPLATGERQDAATTPATLRQASNLWNPLQPLEQSVPGEQHRADRPSKDQALFFEGLPPELQQKIRALLDPRSLFKSMLVSVKWHNLGIDAVLWDQKLADLHSNHQGAQFPQHTFARLNNDRPKILPEYGQPLVPVDHVFADPFDAGLSHLAFHGQTEAVADLELRATVGSSPARVLRAVADAWSRSSQGGDDYQRLAAAGIVVGHLAYSDRIVNEHLDSTQLAEAKELRTGNHQRYLDQLHSFITLQHGDDSPALRNSEPLLLRVVEMSKRVGEELKTLDPVEAIATAPLVAIRLLEEGRI